MYLLWISSWLSADDLGLTNPGLLFTLAVSCVHEEGLAEKQPAGAGRRPESLQVLLLESLCLAHCPRGSRPFFLLPCKVVVRMLEFCLLLT